MKTEDDAVAAQVTVAHEIWTDCFEGLMGQIAGCFPRRESRQTCRQMVEGLLTLEETANCWTLAEALGHSGPHILQHFLSRGRWDEMAVQERLAVWAIGQLGDEEVVLAVDETGDAKSSTDAVGAARQYSGALGGVGLCQVAVHLSYATTRGHTLLDRRLYLGAGWAADDERRELAGVPDTLAFATKPQQAAAMLARAHSAGITDAWVAADEVYGGRELRQAIRRLGYGYVIAVPHSHRVTTPAGTFTMPQLLARLPKRAWQRLRTGNGTKGDRHYDWAMIDVSADDTPAGQQAGHAAVLVRRHRYTRTLSFYRCWHPTGQPLRTLVSVVCRRWRIEEDFQTAKGLTGLDQGQVTCWNSWQRWSLMSLLAYALLAVTATLERHRHGQDATEDFHMIPLTCRELLKQLRVFHLPRPRQTTDPAHALHWSRWRRRHQHRATTCHRRWNEITAAATT